MGQIHCQDIFNEILKHIHYQQRPQSLTISKQIHTLYTKSYIIQDKQTFSNLNDILTHKYFFNLLLGTSTSIKNGIDYRPHIKIQPQHIINLLHNYAFTERTLIQQINSTAKLLIAPLPCIGQFMLNWWRGCELFNQFPKHLQSIIIFSDDKPIPNKISYVSLFQKSNYNVIFDDTIYNYLFLDNTNKMGSCHDVDDTRYYDFPNYSLQHIPDKYNFYSVSDNFFALCKTKKDIKQQYWDIFHNSSKDPQIASILNFLKEYDTTIRKIEM
jgi:hypothetical protein